MEQSPPSPESSRLLFRPLAPIDAVMFYLEITDDLTKHWIGLERADCFEKCEEDFQTSLANIRNGLSVEFIPITKDRGESVGYAGIVPTFEHGDLEFEVVFWVKQKLRGKGYGKEIFATLFEWAKENFTNAPHLIYSVTEGNTESEAIIKRLGLRVVRTWQAPKRGVVRNVTDYELPLR